MEHLRDVHDVGGAHPGIEGMGKPCDGDVHLPSPEPLERRETDLSVEANPDGNLGYPNN
jgi:hypothetical protein